jgi:predicted RNA-binding Zn ribbon-like protein
MSTPSEPHPPTVHPLGHAHVADLEACLDLINSIEYTDGVPEDHLPTVEDGVTYFVQRSLAHPDAIAAQASEDPARWLARIDRARVALRQVWDATVDGRSAPEPAVAEVNRLLAHASPPELRTAVTGVAVGHRHDVTDPTGEALARVVQPLVDALEEGDTSRFRICANDGCRWVFEDTSRGGRRRWCDMTTCGNRAKVRRFRSRRQDTEPVPEPVAAQTPDETPAGETPRLVDET